MYLRIRGGDSSAAFSSTSVSKYSLTPEESIAATTFSESLTAFQASQETLANSDSGRTRHLTHRQRRCRLQQPHHRSHHRRPSTPVSPTTPRSKCTRNNWTDSTYSNIHWPAFFRSLKKRPLTSQLRIQTFSNGWLPVGRIRHRINPDHPDSCPSCLGRNESSDHDMRCRERRRAKPYYPKSTT
jgi:hypothetical protein